MHIRFETILITGGAGFIGTNLVRKLLRESQAVVTNLDLLTYAGHLSNLSNIIEHSRHRFIRGDIGNRLLVRELLQTSRPSAILNLAAETHVDRSIGNPSPFIDTNVVGTFNLIDEVRLYWHALSQTEREDFRFLHVSTDEVYGSLSPGDPAFTETTLYRPNSPYSASKAASDHLVRAYHHTYGLPTLTTNCSNNYGPYQFPEKLIPLIIFKALNGEPLPVYGDGRNVRDWLYVDDHCDALLKILENGIPGETYNIGGNNEAENIRVVQTVCDLLDKHRPRADRTSYRNSISFVRDRPGHDRRYAMNSEKVRSAFDWSPKETFESGLAKTVSWYLENGDWLDSVQTQSMAHEASA